MKFEVLARAAHASWLRQLHRGFRPRFRPRRRRGRRGGRRRLRGGHKFKAKPELRRRVIALELQEVRRRPQVPKPELRRGTIALELQEVRRRPQVPHVVECPKMAAFLESLPRHRLRYCICLPANWPDGTRFA